MKRSEFLTILAGFITVPFALKSKHKPLNTEWIKFENLTCSGWYKVDGKMVTVRLGSNVEEPKEPITTLPHSRNKHSFKYDVV